MTQKSKLVQLERSEVILYMPDGKVSTFINAVICAPGMHIDEGDDIPENIIEIRSADLSYTTCVIPAESVEILNWLGDDAEMSDMLYSVDNAVNMAHEQPCTLAELVNSNLDGLSAFDLSEIILLKAGKIWRNGMSASVKRIR